MPSRHDGCEIPTERRVPEAFAAAPVWSKSTGSFKRALPSSSTPLRKLAARDSLGSAHLPHRRPCPFVSFSVHVYLYGTVTRLPGTRQQQQPRSVAVVVHHQSFFYKFYFVFTLNPPSSSIFVDLSRGLSGRRSSAFIFKSGAKKKKKKSCVRVFCCTCLRRREEVISFFLSTASDATASFFFFLEKRNKEKLWKRHVAFIHTATMYRVFCLFCCWIYFFCRFRVAFGLALFKSD